MSWVDVGGFESWFGDWVSRGYPLSSNSRAFLRYANDSAILLHLAGPFAPPKVIISDMRTYNVPLQLILLADCIMDCANKCCRR